MIFIRIKVCLLVILSFAFQNLLYADNQKDQDDKGKIPVVVITDLYFPYQDPGDNLDLINGYLLPGIDLKGIILDITNAFRKPVADHPTLWKDPRGPREAGFIPILQLNYIFDRNIPYAVGPMSLMESETDKMNSISKFEEQGIDLLLNILRKSPVPIEILSFGSARVLAVAYNRDPELLRAKIRKIYLSAGTAAKNFEFGKDKGANMIPGGEWNVALDVYAFTRILRSDLPVAIFPCAGVDGGFVKDVNNTYWQIPNMNFISNMDIKLQRYLDYAFTSTLRYDFLRAMDIGDPVSKDLDKYPAPFHFWEPPIWLIASRQQIVCRHGTEYSIVPEKDIKTTDKIITNTLRPCNIRVRDDGRFEFEYTDEPTNFSIFFRSNPQEHEQALQQAFPKILQNYRTK